MFKKLGMAARLATSGLRAMPDFIIIGAAKAGTTSLYQYLAEHPCIHPSRTKEVHFFAIHYAKGLGWYRANFPMRATLRLASRMSGERHITGEATPYYLYHPLAAERAAQVVPQAKLIVLLRNPVDRAISNYYFEVKTGGEKVPFEEALDTETARLAPEIEKMRADPDYYSVIHQRRSYTIRGIYVDQIMNWRKYFPKEQMLILKTEDLLADSRRSVRQCCEFLGVREWAPENCPLHNTCEYEKPDPAIRRRLQEFFAPHNRRLYEYLGVDYGWDA
jgi:hypothetical protein